MISLYIVDIHVAVNNVLLETLQWNFFVARSVHFEMKLYNDQRNTQVFNLFINLLLPYMFRAFF
jgi:hypothetical protein